MKKVFFINLLVIMICFRFFSLDCRYIVIYSDRSRNGFLLNLFLGEDLTDQICIVTNLGRRSDPFVEEFIISITDHMTPLKRDKYEYLLRVLLFSVFHPDFDEDELRARILVNKKGVEYLVRQLHVFQDPMLKCQILWMIPHLHDPAFFSVCMTEGDHLLSILKQTSGMPGCLINQEIICLLEIVEQIGNKDYLPLCQSFIQFSRNKQVIEESRQLSKVLLQRNQE